MSNTPPDNAVEQRRRVLKGALAASGVVTMGYSGPALASFACVTTTTIPTTLSPLKSSLDASASWAWKGGPLFKLMDSSTTPAVDSGKKGVKIDGVIYEVTFDTSVPPKPVSLNSTTLTEGTAISPTESVYALAYFDATGSPTGIYTDAPNVGLPAAHSCLTSVNPGLTGYIFGG